MPKPRAAKFAKKPIPKRDYKKKEPAPKNRAPEYTHEEVRYLRYLIDNTIPVRIRMNDNEDVDGTIEYYDTAFIRLTRSDAPNLFIFKHDIKYFYEVPE